jgi:hypothetical protein
MHALAWCWFAFVALVCVAGLVYACAGAVGLLDDWSLVRWWLG